VKPALLRLILIAVLFIGWIGYLAFLAFVAERNPVVLSKPQVLSADLDVIALIQGDKAVVEKVLYPPGQEKEWEHKTIPVVHLNECEWGTVVGGKWAPHEVESGQRYLLPVRVLLGTKDAPDEPRFEVVPIPSSTGYGGIGLLRVYPADAETLAQFDRIPKP
jgi:hypothetical protein